MIQNAHLPSDHAIITCTITLDYNVASEYILQRSSVLGEYHVPLKQQGKKKISFDAVDKLKLKHRLELLTPPIIEFGNIDNCVTWLNNNIFESTSACITKNNKTRETKEANRWNRLLNSNDPKYIWNAIDWKGKMSLNESKDTPSTGDFKVHFEGLHFNSDNVNFDNIDTSTSPYIPLLDDEITTHEMLKCITEVKHNKANDMNGNTPGIVKNLPPALFIFISHLLNAISRFAKFPLAWAVSKLIVLFKKGDRLNCGNYRGIAINDIFFRLFDNILYKRLTKWYIPTREQAGCQKGRSCIEHIMTIRLLIDFAKKKKVKMYILFIDFEKAYDKVVRVKLIEELKQLGCGQIMLNIIIAIYQKTAFLFRNSTINSNMGVKQGSSTSCFLFILYVDRMVKMIKQSFINDGFLGGLHILMLMDDTVLLSTTREGIIEKFRKCQNFSKKYGMTINESKTKFMAINNAEEDKAKIVSHGVTVKYCASYIYLGAPITDDGSYNSVISSHVKHKMRHVVKFYSFLNRNPDLPFVMKERVAEACVMSTLLYGCETWFCTAYGILESLYMRIVEALLAVRDTTCNEVCLFESGMTSLKARINVKRETFLNQKFKALADHDPLKIAFNWQKKTRRILTKLSRMPLHRQITQMILPNAQIA